MRTVEDVHVILHEVNALLHSRGYERLEELLDKAGFSGFVSRTIADRLSRLSKALVLNGYHNGFPDLLPRGVYPDNAVQHGVQGGLEIKASRHESQWQSHGRRSGWFCVGQFEIDSDVAKALQDREPTRLRAMLVAELVEDDWSWQPAREGRIRSGTAAVKPSGVLRLRRGAVWVDPDYEERHNELRLQAELATFRTEAPKLTLAAIQSVAGEVSLEELVEFVAAEARIPAPLVAASVRRVLPRLVAEGRVIRVRPGIYHTSS